MKSILFLTFTLILSGAACKKEEASQVNNAPENGTLTGKVSYANGNALRNTKVVAEHTVWFGTSVETVSNNNGLYSIAIPLNPAGSWTAKAQLQFSNWGQNYKVDLHPGNSSAFTITDAAVRNFTWQLNGARPDGGFYGAHVDLYASGLSVSLEDISIRLTPIDPQLADGSIAQIIERRPEDIAGTFMIKDVPLGKYKAEVIFPGRTILLRNRHNADPAAVSQIVIFGKNGFLAETDYNIEFWVSE